LEEQEHESSAPKPQRSRINPDLPNANLSTTENTASVENNQEVLEEQKHEPSAPKPRRSHVNPDLPNANPSIEEKAEQNKYSKIESTETVTVKQTEKAQNNQVEENQKPQRSHVNPDLPNANLSTTENTALVENNHVSTEEIGYKKVLEKNQNKDSFLKRLWKKIKKYKTKSHQKIKKYKTKSHQKIKKYTIKSHQKIKKVVGKFTKFINKKEKSVEEKSRYN